MISYLNNLYMFIENSYLYCIFENALYITYKIFFILDVNKNIYLFNKLIQCREHRDFKSFL